ncbi:unnamed protein product, partial [marine sediment metagenome]
KINMSAVNAVSRLVGFETCPGSITHVKLIFSTD